MSHPSLERVTLMKKVQAAEGSHDHTAAREHAADLMALVTAHYLNNEDLDRQGYEDYRRWLEKRL